MQEARSLRFAHTVRHLAAHARSNGWQLPSFRSPPGIEGAARTLRRRPDGSSVVAIALRNRPWPAVLADMVEGVVAANGFIGLEAERCRQQLWHGLVDEPAERAAA